MKAENKRRLKVSYKVTRPNQVYEVFAYNRVGALERLRYLYPALGFKYKEVYLTPIF